MQRIFAPVCRPTLYDTAWRLELHLESHHIDVGSYNFCIQYRQDRLYEDSAGQSSFLNVMQQCLLSYYSPLYLEIDTREQGCTRALTQAQASRILPYPESRQQTPKQKLWPWPPGLVIELRHQVDTTHFSAFASPYFSLGNDFVNFHIIPPSFLYAISKCKHHI